MNKNNAAQYLPLIRALAEGKEIEVRGRNGQGWAAANKLNFSGPPSDYRIKPEPRHVFVNEYGRAMHAYDDKALAEAFVDREVATRVAVEYVEVTK